jgi:hypothetical protein
MLHQDYRELPLHSCWLTLINAASGSTPHRRQSNIAAAYTPACRANLAFAGDLLSLPQVDC